MSIFDSIQAADRALDANDLEGAVGFVATAEAALPQVLDQAEAVRAKADLGGIMIDLGSLRSDEAMIARGTQFIEYGIGQMTHPVQRVHLLYNAANGFSALWSIRKRRCFELEMLDASHVRAKALFREAMAMVEAEAGLASPHLHAQLYVNFANLLDSVSRSVEAITYYDRALRVDSTMGMALGNKAMTIFRLAGLAHGHTHQFMLTARELLAQAIQKPLHTPEKTTFERVSAAVQSAIESHSQVSPEFHSRNPPQTTFHRFLQRFCAQNELYLTPSTVLSRPEWAIYGDPLYITRMHAALDDDTKFDRCITFLNQIKQDYILARYFLVQSQFRSDVVDTVDEDVALYYPLDYSLHSAYIQLLKNAFRLTIDVMDKISMFVRDYFGITSVGDERVNYRSIWTESISSTTLRPELTSKKNWFILALFDLALDLRRGGAYEWLIQRRNVLTHRFLVLHDIVIPDEKDGAIPRLHVDVFLRECIKAMQIARAAVFYLVLAVETEESKTAKDGRYGVIPGTPVDDVFRWTPSSGASPWDRL
ncbi:MAG: hypothetical protein IT318_21990 [Anaerolineales bacterium]|nr:hypothetical protein [Anaerolineales bacterium]